MKTTHLLLCVGALISTMNFSACKKYEEGPRLSLHTKKARIANEWKYEKVTSPNGTDVTSYYVNDYIEIKKDGNFISDNGVGTWQFGSDKEIIVFTFSGGSSMIWNIIKLKNNELWTTYASSSPSGLYEFHLIPR